MEKLKTMGSRSSFWRDWYFHDHTELRKKYTTEVAKAELGFLPSVQTSVEELAGKIRRLTSMHRAGNAQ